jgi:hypothetical protein
VSQISKSESNPIEGSPSPCNRGLDPGGGVEVTVRPMETGLQSWLKMSFRLGGDFAAETGVVGGDKNMPPPDVDGGVDDGKRDVELDDDDDGRLC